MSTRYIKADQVAKEIRKQRRLLTGKVSNARYNRMVVAPVMVTGVIMRFLEGKGPDGATWKSGAAVTKLGGKYSRSYNKRPSGRKVSASSIRNTDTGDLANAHTVIKANASTVKVGPGVRGKHGKARVIMEREAKYGNYAVGWNSDLRKILDAEAQVFIDIIARGGTPTYQPRSRIMRRA